jgi:hypothetical protein
MEESAEFRARVIGDRSAAPGPGAYKETKITAYKEKSPEWTLKGRHDLPETPMTAPYRDIGSTMGQGPKISMASRHRTRDVEETPGPGYMPPGLGQGSQKFSMLSRHDEGRDPRLDNPGPGAYSIQPKFANDANKFTLHGRTRAGQIDSCSPGPAAYNPDYSATKGRGPSASMHIRPRSGDITVTPGPSDYNVKRDLGGPAATMHGRPSESTGYVTPGPGAYTPSDVTRSRGLAFTMKSRHETSEQVNTAPYRDIGSTMGQGPKISMASRHRTRDVEETPGPGYMPPGLGQGSQKFSMLSRHDEGRDPRLDNPGPGAYSIQPKFANDANKFTLHGRTRAAEIDASSPGPAAYSPDYVALKGQGRASYMHIRPKDRGPEETPGYLNLPSTLRGPKWTIGNREPLDLIPV